CIPDGMPGKAGAMRFYRAIFPTGMGQSANNLLQVIYFTLLKRINKITGCYDNNNDEILCY
ncbi:MAG: hypothetical protein LBT50_09945, partial [Prevotellaceae bacterium]|nr:hypothetical protein [Prevotellaceae bacterium]